MKDLNKILKEIAEEEDSDKLKTRNTDEYLKLLEDTIFSLYSKYQESSKNETESKIILESRNMITKTRNHRKRLEKALDCLEQYTKFNICMVFLKDENKIKYEVSKNIPDEYIHDVEKLEFEVNQTIFNRAFSTGNPVILNTDSEEYLGVLKKAGMHHLVVIPCGNNGILMASSTCYDINKGDEKFLEKYVENCMTQSLINAIVYGEAHDKANIDYLTDIFNKRYFKRQLKKSIDELSMGDELSLIMIDVDDFKKYNDTYGHLQGDEALRSFAEFLKFKARADDVVARYGGEEFVVLLTTNQNNSEEFVRRIIDDLKKLRIKNIKKEDIEKKYKDHKGYDQISISCGLYSYSLDQDKIYGLDKLDNLDSKVRHIISCADKALYAAKESGKGRYCVFKPIN